MSVAGSSIATSPTNASSTSIEVIPRYFLNLRRRRPEWPALPRADPAVSGSPVMSEVEQSSMALETESRFGIELVRLTSADMRM